jgi:hypothetical protein
MLSIEQLLSSPRLRARLEPGSRLEVSIPKTSLSGRLRTGNLTTAESVSSCNRGSNLFGRPMGFECNGLWVLKTLFELKRGALFRQLSSDR